MVIVRTKCRRAQMVWLWTDAGQDQALVTLDVDVHVVISTRSVWGDAVMSITHDPKSNHLTPSDRALLSGTRASRTRLAYRAHVRMLRLPVSLRCRTSTAPATRTMACTPLSLPRVRPPTQASSASTCSSGLPLIRSWSGRTMPAATRGVSERRSRSATGRVARELNGRHARRLTGDQILCPEPNRQRRVRAFHDGASSEARVACAIATTENAGATSKTVRLTKQATVTFLGHARINSFLGRRPWRSAMLAVLSSRIGEGNEGTMPLWKPEVRNSVPSERRLSPRRRSLARPAGRNGRTRTIRTTASPAGMRLRTDFMPRALAGC